MDVREADVLEVQALSAHVYVHTHACLKHRDAREIYVREVQALFSCVYVHA